VNPKYWDWEHLHLTVSGRKAGGEILKLEALGSKKKVLSSVKPEPPT